MLNLFREGVFKKNKYDFRKDFDPIVLHMCYDGHAERSCAPLKTNGYLHFTRLVCSCIKIS